MNSISKNYDDQLINDFAIRSFRDQADADYISARMAFRAGLVGPALWGSQQTIEKYLKCILLLNRIKGGHVRHDLEVALVAIKKSGKLSFNPSLATAQFIGYIDTYGTYRYLEISNFAASSSLISLDRTAWELRRYCTLHKEPASIALRNGVSAPKILLSGGYLESVLDNLESPARQFLIWNNAFFGGRQRRKIKMRSWMKAASAPLYLNPQILDEVLQYVFLPKDLIRAYKSHIKPLP